MEPDNQKNLYSLVTEKWDYPIGLFAAILLLVGVSFPFLTLILSDSAVPFIQNNIWYIKIIISIFLALCLYSYWLYSRKYPKRHQDKIGILVAIRDDSKLTAQIKQEIVENLNTIIQQTSSGKIMEVLALKNFRARRVLDEKSAVKVSDKTKAQFVIYGRITNLGGQLEFNLEFVVRHRPLGSVQKKNIERGFTEALVDKVWRYLEKDTLVGIKITANNIREICLYIVGIAAHQSFDFEIAKQLHEDLFSLLKLDPTKRKELSPVFQRLPEWISNSYVALAHNAFFQDENLPKALEFNNKALTFQPENYPGTLNQALYLFESGDVKGAKRMINLLRRRNIKTNLRDSAWRFSDAFLKFYEDKYVAGLQCYKKAFAGFTEKTSHRAVIGHLDHYLAAHPDQIQFEFAKAHILINKEENLSLALQPLEVFFIGGGDSDPKYAPLALIAREYLEKIYEISQISQKDRII